MFAGRPFAVMLQELQLTNLYGLNKQMTFKLVDILKNNRELFKLKLSRVNLNDSKVVDILCKLIYCDEYGTEESIQLKRLYSLDLSWASLQPKNLMRIAQALFRA